MEQYLFLWLAVTNVFAFFLMGLDKGLAKKGKRRISEKKLFVFPLLGGGLGGLLGIQCFRHKTKHWYFPVGFALLTLLWLLIMVVLLFDLYVLWR